MQRLTSEVPEGHWAYEALYQIAQRGVAVGRPAEDVSGGRILTRFQMASAIHIATADTACSALSRLRPQMEQLPQPPEELAFALRGSNALSADEKDPIPVVTLRRQWIMLLRNADALQKLNLEFHDELVTMGIDTEAHTRRLSDVRELSDHWLKRMNKIILQAQRRDVGSLLKDRRGEALPDADDDTRLW